MIDKTIPYYNVLMRYDGPSMKECPAAPEGYRFRGYKAGDENAWAQMEVDNCDFDTFENARNYFINKYSAFPQKLQDSFVGIENQHGKLCGIVICWDDIRENEMVSTVHWLVTEPSEQGKGLGKALIRMLIYNFSVRNKLPIYLHTQPWSYVAIAIYIEAGFRLLAEDSFRGYENQSKDALPVLKELLSVKKYDKLIKEMI